ncbi:hypothetical protein TI39_contig4145g00021 [Zymoseptoria brevis]|uniref:Uncharacterized protein n=1 Tax=Zymoseptoria brevis TaxID=1047168 RepID=A0A0F4GFM7_9PEZI|nr:hypothetical protein TI39_contig4145g00021 [Zymoseptoria brevis]
MASTKNHARTGIAAEDLAALRAKEKKRYVTPADSRILVLGKEVVKFFTQTPGHPLRPLTWPLNEPAARRGMRRRGNERSRDSKPTTSHSMWNLRNNVRFPWRRPAQPTNSDVLARLEAGRLIQIKDDRQLQLRIEQEQVFDALLTAPDTLFRGLSTSASAVVISDRDGAATSPRPPQLAVSPPIQNAYDQPCLHCRRTILPCPPLPSWTLCPEERRRLLQAGRPAVEFQKCLPYSFQMSLPALSGGRISMTQRPSVGLVQSTETKFPPRGARAGEEQGDWMRVLRGIRLWERERVLRRNWARGVRVTNDNVVDHVDREDLISEQKKETFTKMVGRRLSRAASVVWTTGVSLGRSTVGRPSVIGNVRRMSTAVGRNRSATITTIAEAATPGVGLPSAIGPIDHSETKPSRASHKASRSAPKAPRRKAPRPSKGHVSQPERQRPTYRRSSVQTTFRRKHLPKRPSVQLILYQPAHPTRAAHPTELAMFVPDEPTTRVQLQTERWYTITSTTEKRRMLRTADVEFGLDEWTFWTVTADGRWEAIRSDLHSEPRVGKEKRQDLMRRGTLPVEWKQSDTESSASTPLSHPSKYIREEAQFQPEEIEQPSSPPTAPPLLQRSVSAPNNDSNLRPTAGPPPTPRPQHRQLTPYDHAVIPLPSSASQLGSSRAGRASRPARPSLANPRWSFSLSLSKGAGGVRIPDAIDEDGNSETAVRNGSDAEIFWEQSGQDDIGASGAWRPEPIFDGADSTSYFNWRPVKFGKNGDPAKRGGTRAASVDVGPFGELRLNAPTESADQVEEDPSKRIEAPLAMEDLWVRSFRTVAGRVPKSRAQHIVFSRRRTAARKRETLGIASRWDCIRKTHRELRGDLFSLENTRQSSLSSIDRIDPDIKTAPPLLFMEPTQLEWPRSKLKGRAAPSSALAPMGPPTAKENVPLIATGFQTRQDSSLGPRGERLSSPVVRRRSQGSSNLESATTRGTKRPSSRRSLSSGPRLGSSSILRSMANLASQGRSPCGFDGLEDSASVQEHAADITAFPPAAGNHADNEEDDGPRRDTVANEQARSGDDAEKTERDRRLQSSASVDRDQNPRVGPAEGDYSGEVKETGRTVI